MGRSTAVVRARVRIEPGTPNDGVTRRRIIRNAALAGMAAWTAPVILDSIASPAAAATPPPCVPQFSTVSDQWDVDDVPYPGCSMYDYHRDLQLTFTVGSCTDLVVVTVTPQTPGAGTDKARWCWSGGSPHATVTHNFAASTSVQTWTTPTAGSTEGGCTHTAPISVDDGIHLNLCQTQQVQYTYKIGAAATVPKYVTVAPNGAITIT